MKLSSARRTTHSRKAAPKAKAKAKARTAMPKYIAPRRRVSSGGEGSSVSTFRPASSGGEGAVASYTPYVPVISSGGEGGSSYTYVPSTSVSGGGE